MELTEIIALGAGVIALIIAVIAYRRSGQPITLQGIQEVAGNTSSLAADLQQVAEVAVASSQQLKESGKLDSNDAAFQHAVNHVERWYNSFAPDIELDPAVVANAVEGAYYWLRKAQGETAPSSDADVLARLQREQSSTVSARASGVGVG